MDTPKTQREQVADERRQHTQKLDQLRSEFAPGRDIDAEYQDHLRRLDEILGESDSGIVDGRNNLY
jgi:hypothetical protein